MARVSKLLDANGNPILVNDLQREIAAPKMGSVRSPIAGDPSGGLTPDRLAVILRQAEQGDPLAYFELAERIEEKDPHYAGLLGTRKRSVAQIDITVEAASEDAGHQAHAEMIRAWLRRDELQDEIVDILDCIGKGVSYTEIIWEASEGQFQPQALKWRDPRFFRFATEDGETPLLRGGYDGAPAGAGVHGVDAVLPGFKFIAAQFRAKAGLAIRGGLTRVACWAWMFKAFTQRDWAIFTQTYGQPIRIGRYEAGATEAEKETLYQAVVNIATDCAAIMPSSMAVEFVEAKSIGASTEHYERRSDWLNREMSKAVLGQTTTTDAVSGGHAVAKEHRLVQEDIERADAKMLSAILNRDLIRPFVILNHGEQKLYPRLVIARPEARDVKMILDGIERAVPLGLKVPKSFLYDLLGIPEAAPGEEVLEVTKSTSVPPGARRPDDERQEDEEQDSEDPPALNMDMPKRDAPIRDAMDRLGDDLSQLAGPGNDAMIAAIREALAKAATLEDARDMLLALQPGLPQEGFAEALRQAMSYGLLAGHEDIASA